MNHLVKLSAQFTSTRSLLLLGLIYIGFMTYFFKFVIPLLPAKPLDSGMEKNKKLKKEEKKEWKERRNSKKKKKKSRFILIEQIIKL